MLGLLSLTLDASGENDNNFIMKSVTLFLWHIICHNLYIICKYTMFLFLFFITIELTNNTRKVIYYVLLVTLILSYKCSVRTHFIVIYYLIEQYIYGL